MSTGEESTSGGEGVSEVVFRTADAEACSGYPARLTRRPRQRFQMVTASANSLGSDPRRQIFAGSRPSEVLVFDSVSSRTDLKSVQNSPASPCPIFCTSNVVTEQLATRFLMPSATSSSTRVIW